MDDQIDTQIQEPNGYIALFAETWEDLDGILNIGKNCESTISF